MDVAKRVARWTEQSPEQWLTAANHYLPPVVSAILVVAIAYKLAALTWAVVPGEPLDGPPPAVAAPVADAAAAQPGTDFSGLVEAHLFGKAPDEPPPQRMAVVDAPDTTLSLRLTGVVTDGVEKGYAIIASGRSTQRSYGIGQAIEGGSGATLHSVYADRVILERGGALETLRLPEFSNGTAMASRRSAPPPPPPPPEPEPLEPVADPAMEASAGGSLREVINDNAASLADVMRASPHVEGGQMVGFRVNPGRERDAFAALGLEPGDVVTDINGTALDDPGRGLQVFESLGEATMANVTLMRDGAVHTLVIDTSQLDSLAEGRQ